MTLSRDERKEMICTYEKERLWFARMEDGSYEVYNKPHNELIGRIRKERTGTWMHYCFVIDSDIMKEMLKTNSYLTYSPGCQDEIRQLCKELGGNKQDVLVSNSKEVKNK